MTSICTMDEALRQALVPTFGDWLETYGCLREGPKEITLVALEGSEPVGVLSVYPLAYPPPLTGDRDAYIDVIEVAESHRRRGVARALVAAGEDWARRAGFRQIRAWSSEDKAEAIPMWKALGYCLCPAVMRGQSVHPESAGKPILGYYVAKLL